MRLIAVMIGLCLLGCDGGPPGPAEPRAPDGAPVASAAPDEASPAPVVPGQPASSAQRYRDAAMEAAYAEYEQAISACAQAEDAASCETSAAATLDTAEKAIRLEYEARLQEEAARSDGG